MTLKKEKAVAVPTALYPDDMVYVERVGTGKNFSQKLRHIIFEHREMREGIAKYDQDGVLVSVDDGAILLYERKEGETVWSDDLPFPYEKKNGHHGLPEVAAQHGFACQIYEKKDTGYIAVWVRPVSGSSPLCKECRKKLVTFINEMR